MEGFFMKLEYSILLIWIVWIMEMYSALGQQVTDEGENLRLALSNCNWLDSPEWCRKSLLIMMTQATTTMEIRPYGLSALNLRSFTHVINAAYSYFNLLQNTK
ncbi:hypothetical protein LSTR_LSTR006566 [Laodelphax striatellus]|uniref:Odorant receptor n=1 Tax=Laodelphax striatellus TaxID=195883 RepID=A0A482WW05_LAOST|nr:hypothetical protein LSTR_LSTR006566 [Laodelphax striatellus]